MSPKTTGAKKETLLPQGKMEISQDGEGIKIFSNAINYVKKSLKHF